MVTGGCHKGPPPLVQKLIGSTRSRPVDRPPPPAATHPPWPSQPPHSTPSDPTHPNQQGLTQGGVLRRGQAPDRSTWGAEPPRVGQGAAAADRPGGPRTPPARVAPILRPGGDAPGGPEGAGAERSIGAAARGRRERRPAGQQEEVGIRRFVEWSGFGAGGLGRVGSGHWGPCGGRGPAQVDRRPLPNPSAGRPVRVAHLPTPIRTSPLHRASHLPAI